MIARLLFSISFLNFNVPQVPTTTVDIVFLNGFPNPENNEAWMILCRDPQWYYQNTKDDNDNGKNEDLFFCNSVGLRQRR